MPRLRLPPAAAPLLFVGCLLACGTEPAAGAAATDTGVPGDDSAALDSGVLDTGALDDGGGDTAPDVAPPEDTGPDELIDDPLVDTADGADAGCTEAGCPCADNGECDSGFCIETAAGPTCAQTCTGSCPADFVCKTLTGSGSDIGSICVPKLPRLCEPCLVQADCQGPLGGSGQCIVYENEQGVVGSFCGGACDLANPCPEGYACNEVETITGGKAKQCQKIDLACACDARAVELQLTTVCSVAGAEGTCQGQRACGPQGLSPCDAATATVETCDGADEDCDGQTDEPGPGVCPDGSPCTYDNCLGAACQHPPAPGPCTDDDACTTDEACGGGLCVGKAVACDDGNPCTKDACLPASGCTATADDGAPCTDGSVCTVADGCQGGACLPGAATACDDSNPCTTDTCDAKAGCVFAPNTLPCSDGDVCSLVDTCAAGQCVPGAQLACDDGNPCTDDGCTPGVGCAFVANSAPCNDNNACTVGDACVAKVCTPVAPSPCDDGNPCTTETCDAQAGCQSAPNTAPCSDDSVCTVGDTCTGGKCAPGKAMACNDGNPCTDDGCDAASGCQFAANTAPCSDGNLCTEGDACADGTCQAASIQSCDDGNACTADACLAKDGCVAVANALPCSDGDPCTEDDACQAKACVAGSAKACDDGNPCTDDACVPGQGCVGTPNTASCSDGNVCTVTDVCKGGACQPGGALDCDDGKPCLTDTCHPATGCKHLPNTAPCDDGNVCTELDVCSGGDCEPGSPKVCSDGNPCTDDVCDKVKGCQQPAAPDGSACGQGWCQQGGCACKPGFVGNGLQCADIDECALGLDGCSEHATCANTAGSFTCKCDAGWQGDGKTCTDVNECAVGNGGCSANATCTNSPGGFACACKAGWQGDGKTCTDVDECLSNNGGCSANATCSNTPGSSTCVCKAGFADCDGNPANDCETNTTTSNSHCNGCGKACGSGTTCVNSTCTTTCKPGDTLSNGKCVLKSVCGKTLGSTFTVFAGGNCSNNNSQYASWYCQLAGYQSAATYTVVKSGTQTSVYYDGGGSKTLSSCSQVKVSSYGFSSTCDGVQNLVCNP